MTEHHKQTIKEHFENIINDLDEEDIIKMILDEELHQEIFNTKHNSLVHSDIQGKDFMLSSWDTIIKEVIDYEDEQLGERFTDVRSPMKIANMYAYIVGIDIVEDYIGNKTDIIKCLRDGIKFVKYEPLVPYWISTGE